MLSLLPSCLTAHRERCLGTHEHGRLLKSKRESPQHSTHSSLWKNAAGPIPQSSLWFSSGWSSSPGPPPLAAAGSAGPPGLGFYCVSWQWRSRLALPREMGYPFPPWEQKTQNTKHRLEGCRTEHLQCAVTFPQILQTTERSRYYMVWLREFHEYS